ncbi:MAG: hypothetical protein BIFFINMI_02102 [Phycisphaerae bacterium]|nr:hypothetical protein [Phycisphaerae bacterium]
MARRSSGSAPTFAARAREILNLPVAHPVNRLGGYGAAGEAIYRALPTGAPSVLVDSQGPATATFMSNGSVAFTVKLPEGMEVPVLDASFDPVEKRETGVPSQNVWLELAVGRSGRRVASLINPNANVGCPADSIRVVKLGDPERSMWFCATFRPAPGVAVESAVRFALVATPAGPALLRQVCLRNVGRRKLTGNLWTLFHMHGTQRFVYNKQLWYDAGLPVTLRDTVVSARVPYSRIVQLKRISSSPANLKPVDATCDYATFVGDTGVLSVLPAAVRGGAMLSGPGTAGRKLSRFATAQIAAGQFALDLAPGKVATLDQSLLYVLDGRISERFIKSAQCPTPRYREIAVAFAKAATGLIRSTPGAGEAAKLIGGAASASHAPAFRVEMAAEPVAAMYANSAWSTVEELYENCRAHGAKMAEGIELGTRDRGQDMWPKMKEDPGRVRADLVHAMGFMYVTCDATPRVGRRPLTLVQKLHGMWPRQFPSRWDHRDQEVLNDNRPYTDSPLWLVDSLNMYIRETGDASILGERVTTIRLTHPDDPIHSGIVGCERTQTVLQAVLEMFDCFARHVADSPYGMAQILYGDWCDPIDMMGTKPVGDATTRGHGRGTQVRLSQHLFDCLVRTIDLLETPAGRSVDARRLAGLKRFADALRLSIVKWAWEDTCKPGFHAGFLDCIHELRADGRVPRYAKGEAGYTLGSMTGRDFDGLTRRILGPQAYGLNMLRTRRDWLTPVASADAMCAKIMRTMDKLFYHPKLGLLLFTTPVANDQLGVDLVGRIGMFPVGCGENGEYHHGQMFMHRFRIEIPGQADTVWRQFKPIMSAMRDDSVAGPFETPCTSYASDRTDPHFGKAMYFGLSGSIDWIVETYQRMAGVQLALHDERQPDLRIDPRLPAALDGAMTFQRIVHVATGPGRYRQVPLTVRVRRGASAGVKINGRPAPAAEVQSLRGMKKVDVEIVTA